MFLKRVLLCSQVLPPEPLPGNMFCKVGSCWAKGASQTWTPGWSEAVERIFFGLMWFKQFSESNKIEHTRYYKMILCTNTHIFHTQVQICGRKCFGIVATTPHRWSKRGKIIILYCQIFGQVYISRSYPSLLVEIWATSKIFLLLLFHQIDCL